MNTPLCNFVRAYAERQALRLHMPGHKGRGIAGAAYDITEIPGADTLYRAQGVIRESEQNASEIFGSHTFYSTEGSSLCIRAMLQLIAQYARRCGRAPRIAAARNVHRTFLSAAALLDLPVCWLEAERCTAYLSCTVTAERLEEFLVRQEEMPVAVYLTSPDYLGNMSAIPSIALVCHRYGVLLAVDNAHGAYLKFLPESLHPIDLGADLCCDSAHKTLPALTPGAYLHISHNAPRSFAEQAEEALALFASTSPSYLILQSLDALNAQLAGAYPGRLAAFLKVLEQCKRRLAAHGFPLIGQEPMKLTLQTRPYGYSGTALAALLEQQGVYSEFSDPDFLVLMPSPDNREDEMARLTDLLLSVPRLPALPDAAPVCPPGERVLSIRQAMLAPHETVPLRVACGRILGDASVSCPPAVPILICGERISEEALACFSYYGVEHITVVAED